MGRYKKIKKQRDKIDEKLYDAYNYFRKTAVSPEEFIGKLELLKHIAISDLRADLKKAHKVEDYPDVKVRVISKEEAEEIIKGFMGGEEDE